LKFHWRSDKRVVVDVLVVVFTAEDDEATKSVVRPTLRYGVMNASTDDDGENTISMIISAPAIITATDFPGWLLSSLIVLFLSVPILVSFLSVMRVKGRNDVIIELLLLLLLLLNF
jgi:hypothetical protein